VTLSKSLATFDESRLLAIHVYRSFVRDKVVAIQRALVTIELGSALFEIDCFQPADGQNHAFTSSHRCDYLPRLIGKNRLTAMSKSVAQSLWAFRHKPRSASSSLSVSLSRSLPSTNLDP
jgi:hypothetical protein